jgi:ribonuclease HII
MVKTFASMRVIGMDEVGRGCWAGPLVAAAVLLDAPIPGLKDSKKLSKLQRETLAIRIENDALAIGIGWVWPATIDSGGITTAVKTAMEQAFEAIGST